MTAITDTDLKEVISKLDQRFDRLEQRLDCIANNLTDLKVTVGTEPVPSSLNLDLAQSPE